MITPLSNQGYYAVCRTDNSKVLYSSPNKVQALIEASNLKRKGISCKVFFLYNHDVFKNFDRTLLGKISLQQLYKERAQQIRDSYDELILYYSGGADSHNVLQTFLKNNIKLDYVFVRWPSKIVDKNFYTANSHDRDARNFVSEWDLVIKHDLEYLKTHHPDIKIIMTDWLEDINPNLYNDDLFATQNHMHGAVNFLRMQSYSDVERTLVDKGKKVAEIWGMDKPILAQRADGSINFIFRDSEFSTARAMDGAEQNRELFYWTPKFPLLAYEMAYQVFLHYKANPQLASILDTNTMQVVPNHYIKSHQTLIQTHIVKQVCYPDWDFARFQAEKPRSGARLDKDFWFYESGEFDPLVERWKHYFQNQFDSIDKEFLTVDPEGKPEGYRIVDSPPYYLGLL